MDMTTCVARRTRSRTESYLNSILNKSKGISESEATLNSRTGNKRGVSLRDTCSPSPRKKKPRRRKVSEDDNNDDDGDVEFVRTDYRKREGVDGDNVGSNSVGLESKSLDCGDRVCDFDLDDDVVFVGTIPRENEHDVEGDNVGSPRVCVDDEKGSSLNPLSPDGDVVFIRTIPGEKEHVEDGNVGSRVCDILLDDINLKGEEKFSDVEGGSVEELGTDSGDEVSGQDRDSDGEDADSDSSDYVVESSDSSYVDSSDGDFVCSEDEEGETRDVAAKEKKSPSEKVRYHKKSRTSRRENNLNVFQLLAKSIWDGKKVFEEDICSGDETVDVDCREDAIVRESSSEKVNEEQGKPRRPRSFHRVKEKNHLKGESFVDGEKLCDGQETIHCSTEDSPPLILRFGCEEPVLIEKTDEEKELDSLWEDMAVALTLEGMDSSTPAKVGDMLCSKERHDFVLEEEIGLICRHCSHVAVEIKDISPAMDKYRANISDNKKCSEKKGDPLFNRLEFDASDHSSYPASLDNTEGTVWQYVPGIRDTLYPHQQEGFEFIWKNLAGTTKLDEFNSVGVKGSGGCIISHKAGTGKTRLTIVFLQSYLERFPDSHPVVIAPATLMRTWEEECRKWNADIPFFNMNSRQFSGYEDASAVARLNGNRQHNSVRMVKLYSWWNKKSILGVSYPLYEKLAADKNAGEMQVFRRMLLELPGLLVLDEGHTPRNQNSLIWKVLTEVRTEKRIILSGTLFQNNFKELSNVLCLARPALKDTLSSMLQELSKRSQEGEHGRVNEEIGIVDLKVKIAPFVHVHEGNILEESLPGLKDCVVVLNPPFQQKKILDRIDTSQNTFEFEHKLSAVSVHPSLYLCCNPTKKEDLVIGPATLGTLKRLRLDYKEGVKTKFLINFIRITEKVKEKVLVYSQYIDTLKLIMEQLSAEFSWTEGEEILLMHGKVEQRERQQLINNFNKQDSKSKVLLASTKACSEGISLVGASRVVFLDVVWNPSVESQAISRAYRIGQKRAVFVYHLMVKDTSEWDKYCKQSEKYRISELVFSSTNEKDKPINNEAVSEDRILDEMVRLNKLKDIFEKILYNPKESDMFTSIF
ncbi:PREDICTED: SNF2 domain-containing protein CLASSY 4-like [Camelina sativa]|uniref:SNF2 domain-containing protein CLASSY 4-like n=1 Tax=Camelina sativa TaxID=90675 RepID=A0ABM0ZBR4_CAMSA|nr:PREDICTED: SNF2 domain-containing protein CLASSY 4-like [Camelina sativa]